MTQGIPKQNNNDHEANEEQSSSESTITQFARSIFFDKAILTVLLGALGYFLGWRFLYTYYGSFGLDSVYFSFPPSEVISAGWRIYVIIAALILLAQFILIVGQKGTLYIIQRKGLNFSILIFYLFLIFSIVLSLGFNYLVQQADQRIPQKVS